MSYSKITWEEKYDKENAQNLWKRQDPNKKFNIETDLSFIKPKIWNKPEKTAVEYTCLEDYKQLKEFDMIFSMIKNIQSDNFDIIIDVLFGTFIPFTKNGVRQLLNCIIETSSYYQRKTKILFDFTRELLNNADSSNYLGRIDKLIYENFQNFAEKSVGFVYYCYRANYLPNIKITVINCDTKNYKENKFVCDHNNKGGFIFKVYQEFERIDLIKDAIQMDDAEKLDELYKSKEYQNYNNNNFSSINLKANAARFCATKCFEYLVNLERKGDKTQTMEILNNELINVLLKSIRLEDAIFIFMRCHNDQLFNDGLKLILSQFGKRWKYSLKIAPMYFQHKLISGIDYITKCDKMSFKKRIKLISAIVRERDFYSFKYCFKAQIVDINNNWENIICFLISTKQNSSLKFLINHYKNKITKLMIDEGLKSKNVKAMLLLLPKFVLNEEFEQHREKLLSQATLSGSIELMKLALNYVKDVNYAEEIHPLYVAVEKNSVEQVKLLLSVEGIDVNSTNCGLPPPLCLAIRNKQEDIVNLLLSREDIDVNKSSTFGSPLSISCMNKDIELMNRLLLIGDVDINAESSIGSIFYVSCLLGDSSFYEAIKRLPGLNHSFDPQKYQFNALYGCCVSGNINIVEDLVISYGYDVNSVSFEGSSLFGAISHDHFPIVRFLIEHGADYNQTFLEMSPLSVSVSHSNFEIFEYLMSLENIQIDFDELIMTSVRNKNIEIFKILIEKAGDIDGDILGDAYLFAAHNNHVDLMEIIYKKGQFKEKFNSDVNGLSSETLKVLIDNKKLDISKLDIFNQIIESERIDVINYLLERYESIFIEEVTFITITQNIRDQILRKLIFLDNNDISDNLLKIDGIEYSKTVIQSAIKCQKNYFIKKLFEKVKISRIDFLSISMMAKNDEMTKLIFDGNENKSQCYEIILTCLNYLNHELFQYFINQPGFTNGYYYQQFIWETVNKQLYNFFKELIALDEQSVNMIDNSGYSLFSYVCSKKSMHFIEFILEHKNFKFDPNFVSMNQNSTELVFNHPKFLINENDVHTVSLLLKYYYVSLEEFLTNDKFREVIFIKEFINNFITAIINSDYALGRYINLKYVIKLYVNDHFDKLTRKTIKLLINKSIELNDSNTLYSIVKQDKDANLNVQKIFEDAIKSGIDKDIIREMIKNPEIELTSEQFRFICKNKHLNEFIPIYLSNQKIKFERNQLNQIIDHKKLKYFKYIYDDPRNMITENTLSYSVCKGTNEMILLLLNRTKSIPRKIFNQAIEHSSFDIIKLMMKKLDFTISSNELISAIDRRDINIVKLFLSVPSLNIYHDYHYFDVEHPLEIALVNDQKSVRELLIKHPSFDLTYSLLFDFFNRKLLEELIETKKVNEDDIISILVNTKKFYLLDYILQVPGLEIDKRKLLKTIEENIIYIPDEILGKLLENKDFDFGIDFSKNEDLAEKKSIIRMKFYKFPKKHSLIEELDKFRQMDTVFTAIQNVEEETLEETIDTIFGTYAPFTESGIKRIFNFIFRMSKITLKKNRMFAKLLKNLIELKDESNCLEKLVDLIKSVKNVDYILLFKELSIYEDLSIDTREFKKLIDPTAQIIIDDNIEDLQELAREINFDFKQNIDVRKICSIESNKITILEFSAFCGSLRCFKYLLVNGASIPLVSQNPVYYPIIGQNFEIIRIYEQKKYQFGFEALQAAGLIRNFEIYTWIMEKIPNNYSKQRIIEHNVTIIKQCFYEAYIMNEAYQNMDTQMIIALLFNFISHNEFEVLEAILIRTDLIIDNYKTREWIFAVIKDDKVELFELMIRCKNVFTLNKATIHDLLIKAYENSYKNKGYVLFALLKHGLYDKDIFHGNFVNKALKENDLNIVKKLLSYKEIDFQSPKDAHPLYVAVEKNSVEQVKLLLSVEGIDVNSTNCGLPPPLCLAIRNKQEDIVNLLLSREDIDVNKSSTFGSPLSISCMNKDIELMNRLLLIGDVDINAESSIGSIFYVSCLLGDFSFYEVIKRLPGLNHSFDPQKYQFNALYGCCVSGNINIVEDLVISYGYDVNSVSFEGSSLFGAISHDHFPIVRFLIEHDADYNQKTEDGLSYIMYSVKFQFFEIFKYLLSLKEEDEDMSLIDYAVGLGYTEYCSLILNKFKYNDLGECLKIALNEEKYKLFNVLMSYTETSPTTESILSKGLVSFINARTDDMNNKAIRFIDRLLEIPDLNLKLGESLIKAVKLDRFDIFMKLLKYKSINVNYVCQGMTALSTACEENRYYFVKELLKIQGIDVNLGEKHPIELCRSINIFWLLFYHPNIDFIKIFESIPRFYESRKDLVERILNDEKMTNLTNEQLNQAIIIILKNMNILLQNQRNFLNKDIVSSFYQIVMAKKDFVLSEESIKYLLKTAINADDFMLFKTIINKTGFTLSKEMFDNDLMELIIYRDTKFIMFILKMCEDLEINYIETKKGKINILSHYLQKDHFEVFKALVNYKTIDINCNLLQFDKYTRNKTFFIKYNEYLLDHPEIKIDTCLFYGLCADKNYHKYVPRFIDSPEIDINYHQYDTSILKAVILTQDYDIYKKIINHPKLILEKEIIDFACDEGHVAIILDLLNHDDIYITDETIHYAIEHLPFDVVKKLFDHVKTKMNVNNLQQKALVSAVEKNKINVVKYLINRPVIEVGSCLKIALKNDSFEIVDILINGCKVFDEEIIKLSLSKGCLPKLLECKYFNKTQNIALSLSIVQPDLENFELLLNVPGIDVNYYEKEYPPPLTVALMYRKDNVVRRLLEVPGIKFEFDQLKISPFYVTTMKNLKEMEKLLLEKSGLDESVLNKYREAMKDIK